jgi:hypothetical protein
MVHLRFFNIALAFAMVLLSGLPIVSIAGAPVFPLMIV